MDEYKVLLQKAKEIENPLKKKIFFLGIMTEALKEKNLNPVIVGGCALEFYSTGGYTTGDIDIIYHNVELLGKILEEWGFHKEGRHWINEEFDIFLEVPGSYLPENERDRITLVEIEGLKVYLVGIEDLIIDRLNAFVHWKSTDDGYWAKELIFIYRDKLDMDYVKKRCTEEETEREFTKIIQEVYEIEKN